MAGTTVDRAMVVPREQDAAEAALRMARPDDLVVITATHVFERWEQIRTFDPEYVPLSRGKVSHLKTA